HVAHLVAEHAGELVVARHLGEEAREHEDVATRDREGVQRWMLDDEELVVELLRTERRDQPTTDAVHVLAHGRVVDDRQLGARFEEDPAPERALARLARRAGGTRARERAREDDRDERTAGRHRRPRPRATSFAKYVMTTSAPARRIAVRLSSTTR